MPRATPFVQKEGRKYIGREKKATEAASAVLELVETLDQVERISLGSWRYVSFCDRVLSFQLNKGVVVLDVRPCHVFQKIELKVTDPGTVLRALRNASSSLEEAGLILRVV